MSLKTFIGAKKYTISGIALAGVVSLLVIRNSSRATSTPYPSNRCSQYVHDTRTYGIRYFRIWADSILSFPLVGDTVQSDTCHVPQLYALGPNSLWWYDGHRNFEISGGMFNAANGLNDSLGTALLGGLLYKSTDIEMTDDSSFSINGDNFDPNQPFFQMSAGTSSMGYNFGASQVVLIAAADRSINLGPIHPAVVLEAPNFTTPDSVTGWYVLGDSAVLDDNISFVPQTPYVAFDHNYTRIKQLATTNTAAFVQADVFGRLTSASVNPAHTIFNVPTTGTTVNLVLGQYNVINSTGVVSPLTLNFPAGVHDGDILPVKFDVQVSSITFTGATTQGQFTSTLPAGSNGRYNYWVWDAATTSWY